MTNQQLYILLGVPFLANAVLIGLLVAYINAKIEGLRAEIGERFAAVNERFNSINERFNSVNERFNSVNQRFNSIDVQLQAMNQRFDDMRDLWRAELHRVEEVLDARLKHLEER
jgi:predicted  nucleic acid-binding Zn-ribbon protein